ncbi:Oligopeptide transporter 4 [Populus alba x Populus x berolinensis]|nr:Oligopeptide transporter 4 [Populus alba x Populus x berolinensis]
MDLDLPLFLTWLCSMEGKLLLILCSSSTELLREIYDRYRASSKGKEDIHTRLMKNYEDIPSWWFHGLPAMTLLVVLFLCIFLKKEVQMPFRGLLFAAALAFIFSLHFGGIITATTNQTPGLNIITEYVMGILYPGRPIANVCFKTYGYMSNKLQLMDFSWNNLQFFSFSGTERTGGRDITMFYQQLLMQVLPSWHFLFM